MYEDGSSFCFSCSTHFKADHDSTVETPVREPKVFSKETVEEIRDTYPSRGFRDRKIEKLVCEFYNVKVSYGPDGEINAHYYPYSGGGYKKRSLPKSFVWIGNAGGLFGRELFNGAGKRLIITEGEIDALTIAQANYDKYKNKFYPVISISSAAATKDLLEHRDWIRSFKEVVLALDADKAGEEATQKAIRIIGIDKVKIWKPPFKDANEVYVKLGGDRLLQCIWDAAAWSPVGIIKKEEIWEAIQKRNLVESVPYPECLSGINKKIRGMRMGEIALFISGTGCLAYDTEVLMFDGSIKKIQNIEINEQVMGPDNLPRTVKQLYRGKESMVRVQLRDGDYFDCNINHVLSLVNNDHEGRWGLSKDQIVDVSVVDYLLWSDKRKHLSKSFKTSMLEFSKKELPMHPYAIGVWLGDGYSAGSRISSNDIEIPNKLLELGFDVEKQSSDFAWSFRGVHVILKDLNLINNKHIPEIYLTSNIEDRLALLAGLLDTDGSYDTAKNMFEFSQKSELITDQFVRLAKSLGYTTTKGKQQNNKFGNCFRVWLSGENLELIPTVLPRKQARPRAQIKNPHRYSFKIINLSIDDFYGFELDGDGRFVLGNFIVTHNSGKSTIMREIGLHVLATTKDKLGIISLEESPAETGIKLSGMAINKNSAFTEIPEDELKVGFDKVFGDDRVVLLDHQGSIKDDSILDQLEYMCLVGCKYLIIDHITILVSEGAEDLVGNEAIDKIMNDLLRLVKRHEVWVGLVSHLRKAPVGKKSFEEGRLPNMDDIRGSGSIKQVSFDIIAFARNMLDPDEDVRNSILMSVLKSRTIGLTGPVEGAYYVHETGRLVHMEAAPIDQFEKLG
jgi:hypothetical protein